MVDVLDMNEAPDLVGGHGPVHEQLAVLLSALLRAPLRDQAGKRGKVIDLVVDVTAGDYPPVVELVYAWGRGTRALSWAEVQLARSPLSLTTFDLAVGRPLSPDAHIERVLLRRDIRDMLVLDLVHCRATRANDLLLNIRGNALRLAGADTSPWAVLRRLGRGALGRGNGELLDWRRVVYLRGDARAAHVQGDSHRRLAVLPAPSLARLAAAIPYPHAVEMLTMLPEALAADVLELSPPERRLQIIEEMDTVRAANVLAQMAPDVAADLLGTVGKERVSELLARLPEAHATRIVDLLRYPEDTAGGIMINVVLTAPAGWTIAEARQRLRPELRALDFVLHVFILDDREDGRFVGVLTLRDLLTADDAEPLRTVMRRPLATIQPLETARDAAWRVVESHEPALPVVRIDGRLLGAVTMDAAVRQIAPDSWARQAPRVFS